MFSCRSVSDFFCDFILSLKEFQELSLKFSVVSVTLCYGTLRDFYLRSITLCTKYFAIGSNLFISFSEKLQFTEQNPFLYHINQIRDERMDFMFFFLPFLEELLNANIFVLGGFLFEFYCTPHSTKKPSA